MIWSRWMMPSTVTRRSFVATLVTSAGIAALHADAAVAAAAQAAPAAPPDPNLIADVVAGNHILVRKGVIQINGHLSARHTANRNRFFLARAIAPETVTKSEERRVGKECRSRWSA